MIFELLLANSLFIEGNLCVEDDKSFGSEIFEDVDCTESPLALLGSLWARLFPVKQPSAVWIESWKSCFLR